MKLKNLIFNLVMALLIAAVVTPEHVFATASGIVLAGMALKSIVPQGVLPMALQTEVWVRDIKENPVPDHSFINASTDMSEHVENNTLHLAEAGIEPGVHEDYFAGNEDPLPVANIEDIPNEVVLKTYSTEQTRHRQLQDVELQYNKRQSIINRHRTSLEKNLGKRAAFAWTPGASDAYNEVKILGGSDSVIDAIIDMELFYRKLDKGTGLNLCLSPEHMAKIRKEDKDLYKDIVKNPGEIIYGFKIYSYSQTPLFTSADVKKPFGATAEAGDKPSSFTWATDEVFRCFGSVDLYATLRDSGLQADILSFAQRALVGKIRANSPKYLGSIV